MIGSTITILGLKFFDDPVHLHQMTFQTEGSGSRRIELEQSLVHPPAEVEADRRHVPNYLIRGFFEREESAAFTAGAGGGGKMRGQARFASASRS